MTETLAQRRIAESQRTGFATPDFDDQQFADWAALLESRCGLYIGPDRKSFLASGLRERMRKAGYSDYQEYFSRMRSGTEAEEWSMLVDCLTVHETRFFRHAASYALVQKKVIPETTEDAAAFSAWSVGCASGEEVYSLAMLADTHTEKNGLPKKYGITGTDISGPSLMHAKKGEYINRRMEGIPPRFRKLYTRSVSATRFEMVPMLKKRVCFARLNLRDIERVSFHRFALIYCQNVLIYYQKGWRDLLLGKLVERLRPGGYLILAPGEIGNWTHPFMQRVPYEDTLAYRRVEQ